MAKFHINPSTGNPGPCKAARACPFGGADRHFDSAQEARTAFELEMGGDNTIQTMRKAFIDTQLETADKMKADSIRKSFVNAVDSRAEYLDKAYEALPPLTPPAGLTTFDRTTYVEERQKELAKIISGQMELYRKEFDHGGSSPDSDERSKKRREKIADLMVESIDQKRSLIPKSSFLNRKEVAERHADLDRQIDSIRQRLSV